MALVDDVDDFKVHPVGEERVALHQRAELEQWNIFHRFVDEGHGVGVSHRDGVDLERDAVHGEGVVHDHGAVIERDGNVLDGQSGFAHAHLRPYDVVPVPSWGDLNVSRKSLHQYGGGIFRDDALLESEADKTPDAVSAHLGF